MNTDRGSSFTSPGARRDPFGQLFDVPVAGGTLAAAYAGVPLHQSAVVVLAIHGITGNRMVWRAAARELTGNHSIGVLAADLRGRGENAALPGPYGIETHVADMLAILDHTGVDRALLVGHSMGAFVAARIAVSCPERAAGLVLVDGGIPVSEFTEATAAALRAFLLGPAVARQAIRFTSVQAYVDFWRHHPALALAWNDDVEAYVLHELRGRPGSFKYVVSVEAIEADGEEMLCDAANRDVTNRLQIPMQVIRAPAGALGENNPLIPQVDLDAFVARHPAAHVEEVAGVNHYTLLLGDSPGPPRVAAAIEAAAGAAPSLLTGT